MVDIVGRNPPQHFFSKIDIASGLTSQIGFYFHRHLDDHKAFVQPQEKAYTRTVATAAGLIHLPQQFSHDKQLT
jgi:hypothetical protein